MTDTTNSATAGAASVNDTVLNSAPDVAVSIFYQAANQAFSLTMQNAASNQQNLNALNPTIVAHALKLLGA